MNLPGAAIRIFRQQQYLRVIIPIRQIGSINACVGVNKSQLVFYDENTGPMSNDFCRFTKYEFDKARILVDFRRAAALWIKPA